MFDVERSMFIFYVFILRLLDSYRRLTLVFCHLAYVLLFLTISAAIRIAAFRLEGSA